MKGAIPVYDIGAIDHNAQKDLLVEKLGPYLHKHYEHLRRPHRHSFYHLVLFTNGKGKHTIDFQQFPVRAFQVYFMIPGQVHSWEFEGKMEGYVVHFNEALFSTYLQNGNLQDQYPFFSGHSHDSVCQLPVTVSKQSKDLFERMILESKENSIQSIDMIRIKLLEFFILVERSCRQKRSGPIPSQKRMLLRSFQKLIEKNYRLIRLPKEYAELLYITPNHLNALCQDLLGKTAGDLIRDRILLEAKRLLTNADMTVTEIAYELNFEDNSYFNRFFKKNVGMTPDEFRKTFVQSK